jgi:hypothetical protein
VNQYTANDPTTNYPTQYTLYFSITGNTLQSTEYIVAGTLIGDYCTTINSTDAKGLGWTINSHQYQYANGYGGSTYTDNTNTMECGFLPSGYWTYYIVNELIIYYYDQNNSQQFFVYGNESGGDQADGTGNTYPSTDGITLYYPIGYIFYSYYDEAGQQTVNYCFDGTNSYYISYS